MNTLISTNRRLSLSLAFAGLFPISGLAVAQQADEEIIVRASEDRVVDVTPVGSQVTIKEIEVRLPVDTSDLDLSNSADVQELDTRIEAVAKESCQKLSDMSPLDRANALQMSDCIKKAVASAGKQREIATTAGY